MCKSEDNFQESPLLLSCGSRPSNTGYQALWQAPSPTEPPLQPFKTISEDKKYILSSSSHSVKLSPHSVSFRFLPLPQPRAFIYRSCQNQQQPCWSKFEVSKFKGQHGYGRYIHPSSSLEKLKPGSRVLHRDATPELPLDNGQSLKVLM